MKIIKNKVHSIANDASFFSEKTLGHDNLILLFSIVTLILIFPLFDKGFIRAWLFDIIVSAIIISGVTSLQFKKEKFIRLAYFGLLTFTLLWVQHFIKQDVIKLITFFVLIIFLIYITYSMIKHVAITDAVNSVMILNAINSYLLLGVIGAFLFISVEVGNSFFAHAEHTLNFSNIANPLYQDFIYFSFITITTLGYGDITPALPITKSLTIALSLAGQLYLTILVAMLMGKFLSQKKNNYKTTR